MPTNPTLVTGLLEIPIFLDLELNVGAAHPDRAARQKHLDAVQLVDPCRGTTIPSDGAEAISQALP